MTKAGFKQVMLSIDTYNKIKLLAKQQKTSINRVISNRKFDALNPTVVGSNPPQPAIDFFYKDKISMDYFRTLL